MMEEMQAAADDLGIKLGAVLIGFFGASLGLLYNKNLSTGRKAVFLISGTASAAFFPSTIAMWLDVDSQGFISTMGFLCGLTGMHFINGITKIAQSFSSKPLEVFDDIKTRVK